MNISRGTIDRLVAGDPRAFQEIFHAAYPRVFSFVLSLAKDMDDTEDIVQNVFIKLWTKRERLAPIRNLDAYLFTLTKNTVLNHFASQKACHIDISTIGNLGTDDVSAIQRIEAQDLQMLIDMVIENMPPQRKSVFLMSREEGLSNDEIAQRMGLSKKTVENHLNLALGDIRKMLKFLILLFIHWG